ncbi:MAG TPA: hypothetical protein VK203_23445, partial [Nostocaceae cyanobacterium]|nr:hypothetical protein [Nostocaceae cyanobacterium]
MYSRLHRNHPNSSQSSHTPTTNRFAAPKFFAQPQTEANTQQQEPISAAELEKIIASDSNWPDVSMFTTNRPAPAPPPRVQMKLNTDRLREKNEQNKARVVPETVQPLQTQENQALHKCGMKDAQATS